MTARRLKLLAPAALAVAVAAVAAQAHAAAGGGLSLTPAALEQFARPGAEGAITLSNGSASPLKITITARPWRQARDASVVPNRAKTLSKYIAFDANNFTLAPGATRHVVVNLRKLPTAGSLYGSIEVVGIPPKTTNKRSGIIAAYRLVGSMRLDPHAPKRKLKPGTVHMSHGRLLVAMTNKGNTVDPVIGTAVIRGPRGTRNIAIPATRILPGSTVDLALGATKGLPKGSYTVRLSLFQGSKPVLTARRGFRVRS